MSAKNPLLELQADDCRKMIAASVHLGSQQCQYQMEQYVYKTRADGVHVVDSKKTWEKIMLAARVIAAVENPADVCVISSRTIGQRAILKFAAATGATAVAGRFTPGAFTNQIQKAFREPRLLIVTDPRADHQPITESSYVNIPVVALCDTDSPTRFVDVAIPCNNKGKQSVGLIWWFLAREVLRLRGTIAREQEWDVMPDLYFFRDQDEIEKDEEVAQKAAQEETEAAPQDWSAEAAPGDWNNEPEVGAEAPAAAGAEGAAGATAVEGGAEAGKVDDWAAQSTQAQKETGDWGENVEGSW